MRRNILLFGVLALTLATACTKDNLMQPQSKQQGRVITVTASLPNNGNPQTRTAINFGVETRDIIVKWKAGDDMELFFKQTVAGVTTIEEAPEVSLKNFSNGNKTAQFDVIVPQGIDPTQAYTLYGVHGTNSLIDNGRILVSLKMKAGEFNSFDIPLYFKTEVTPGSNISAQFKHLGALMVFNLKNTSSKELKMLFATPILFQQSGSGALLWFHYSTSDAKCPHLNLEDNAIVGFGNVSEPDGKPTIMAGEDKDFAFWAAPQDITTLPASKLAIQTNENGATVKYVSADSYPARTAPQIGHAYHIKAEWNGTALENIHLAHSVTVARPLTTQQVLDALGSGANLVINGELNNADYGAIQSAFKSLPTSHPNINLTLQDITKLPAIFYNIVNIESLSLPEATSIDEYALKYCSSLKKVSMPKVISLGKEAFSKCDKLTSVFMPQLKTVPYRAFFECKRLTSASFPEVTQVDREAFFGCSALTSINLPKLQTLDIVTFQHCEALTSISLPEATTIGGNAFYGCKALVTASLPKATSVGVNAFSLCEKLTTLELRAAGNITLEKVNAATPFYNGLASTTPTNPNINLKLNSDKQSQVTGGNTWQGITFKTINF